MLNIIFVAVLLQPKIAAAPVDFNDPHRIVCSGELPPGRYGESFYKEGKKRMMRMKLVQNRIAMNWSAKNFTSLADLCTARGNPEGNMGGVCEPDEEPIFNYTEAIHAFLFDFNIYENCKRNCRCPVIGNDRLLNEQLESKDRKGTTRIASLSSSSQQRFEENPRPPMKGQLMMSSQRDWRIGRGKEELRKDLAVGRLRGGKLGPAVRVSSGRRPLGSTFNANGNARTVAGLGRVGIA